MEKWFEYYISFTLGNLGWWRSWFIEKQPSPETVKLIDEISEKIAPVLESCRPTLRTPDENPVSVQAEVDALCERLAENHVRLKSAFRR